MLICLLSDQKLPVSINGIHTANGFRRHVLDLGEVLQARVADDDVQLPKRSIAFSNSCSISAGLETSALIATVLCPSPFIFSAILSGTGRIGVIDDFTIESKRVAGIAGRDDVPFSNSQFDSMTCSLKASIRINMEQSKIGR